MLGGLGVGAICQPALAASRGVGLRSIDQLAKLGTPDPPAKKQNSEQCPAPPILNHHHWLSTVDDDLNSEQLNQPGAWNVRNMIWSSQEFRALTQDNYHIYTKKHTQDITCQSLSRFLVFFFLAEIACAHSAFLTTFNSPKKGWLYCFPDTRPAPGDRQVAPTC